MMARGMAKDARVVRAVSVEVEVEEEDAQDFGGEASCGVLTCGCPC